MAKKWLFTRPSKMGSKTVTKRMRYDALGELCLSNRIFQDTLDLRFMQMISSAFVRAWYQRKPLLRKKTIARWNPWRRSDTSAAVFQKRGKSRVRPGGIAAGFVFCSAAFRWINESVPIQRRGVNILGKNQGNNAAISCNGVGEIQELHVVAGYHWT